MQLIGFVSFGTWLFTAIFAPMFFDGGNHWRVWALFLATLSGPVLVALASVFLWVAYYKQWGKVHMLCVIFLLLSLFPLLSALT
jgi:hypothetical protein